MADAAPVWDRHSIKAEIERRGATLTGLSRKAGLYDAACRQALGGGSYAGAQAISAFLGVPMKTLFPGFYRTTKVRGNRIRKTSPAASQNSARPSAVARAS